MNGHIISTLTDAHSVATYYLQSPLVISSTNFALLLNLTATQAKA